jgi:hypothetical protein
MPGKLVVVVVLLGVAIVLNILGAALVSAGIQGVLLFGVLIGNDGVRTFLRGLAAVNIVIVLVMSIPAMQAADNTMVLIMVAISVSINGYMIWALGQEDVREWMFRKNFKLDEGGGDDVPRL